MNEHFWRGRRVAVTGGSGFIGRWVVSTLVSLGAELEILDLLCPDESARAGQSFRQVDLRDLDAVVQLVRERNPEVLIHLAGQGGVSESHSNPIEAFERNIVCTYNTLEACRRSAALVAIVVASSNHIYGPQRQQPTGEEAPLNGESIYGTSKLCADVIARAYGKTYGLPVSIARFTNSFGGNDPHLTHIVTSSIISTLNGGRPVISNSGDDSKGFLYVKDLVNGLLILAEKTAVRKELHGEAFNFSPDSPTSVKELVNEVISVTGRDIEPEILQPGADYGREHLGNARARNVLGWTPSCSLREGLEETIAWYQR